MLTLKHLKLTGMVYILVVKWVQTHTAHKPGVKSIEAMENGPSSSLIYQRW